MSFFALLNKVACRLSPFHAPVLLVTAAMGVGCASSDGDSKANAGVGGGTSAAPEEVLLTPEAMRFLGEIDKMSQGLAADLDGDGWDDAHGTQEGDSTVWTYDPNMNGYPAARRVWNPATKTGVTSFAYTSQKEPRRQTTRTGVTTVSEEDVDEDGTFDRKTTITRDEASGLGHMVVEVLSSETNTWVVVRDEKFLLRKKKCPRPAVSPPDPGPAVGPESCEVFPSGGVGQVVKGYDIGTYTSGTATDSADGRCSLAHAARLYAALSCAFDRYNKCIKSYNPDEYARLVMEIASGGHIHLACGNNCKDTGASAISHGSDPAHTDINWNPALLDGTSDDELCASMLHELMHFASSPDDGQFHDLGDDQVYACGRYCGGKNGCATGNRPPGCNITDTEDCATCATPENKPFCGLEDRWVEWPISMACKDGGQCPLTLGECMVACDDTVLQCMTQQPCCKGCLSGFDCAEQTYLGKLGHDSSPECSEKVVCPPK